MKKIFKITYFLIISAIIILIIYLTQKKDFQSEPTEANTAKTVLEVKEIKDTPNIQEEKSNNEEELEEENYILLGPPSNPVKYYIISKDDEKTIVRHERTAEGDEENYAWFYNNDKAHGLHFMSDLPELRKNYAQEGGDEGCEDADYAWFLRDVEGLDLIILNTEDIEKHFIYNDAILIRDKLLLYIKSIIGNQNEGIEVTYDNNMTEENETQKFSFTIKDGETIECTFNPRTKDFTAYNEEAEKRFNENHKGKPAWINEETLKDNGISETELKIIGLNIIEYLYENNIAKRDTFQIAYLENSFREKEDFVSFKVIMPEMDSIIIYVEYVPKEKEIGFQCDFFDDIQEGVYKRRPIGLDRNVKKDE